jgi:hypothetical protein
MLLLPTHTLLMYFCFIQKPAKPSAKVLVRHQQARTLASNSLNR